MPRCGTTGDETRLLMLLEFGRSNAYFQDREASRPHTVIPKEASVRATRNLTQPTREARDPSASLGMTERQVVAMLLRSACATCRPVTSP